MPAQFKELKSSQIAIGMKFSAPVFFDDGKNMFLAQGKPVKPYHIAALARWKIQTLLTYGYQLTVNSANSIENEAPSDIQELDDAEEIEEIEEVEEL